jgi:aryl-alcohol dehydrogenase-like predicted oxidoreductase
MQYTQFGETDLNVSKICFGTWAFGGDWGDFDQEAAIAAMRRALELGVNFFDTAQAYGFGKSEKLVARALRDEIKHRRDQIMLATKGGLRMQGDEMLRDSSREWLRQGLEDSLRFLETDYIDLYQVHWPDADTSIEETAAALDDFVKEGKVRYVGVSNFNVPQMQAFQQTRKLDSLQPPYNMFRREVEDQILPYCQENGIGVLAYSTLASGLLTGKYSPDQAFQEDDWRSESPSFHGEPLRNNLQVVDRLQAFAEARGYDATQLAIAWVLANPAVDVAIVGAKRPGHIEGSAPAAKIQLSEADLEEIEGILADAERVKGATPEGVEQ